MKCTVYKAMARRAYPDGAYQHGMQGFTLLELAIAVVILSLLSGWLIVPLRMYLSQAAYRDNAQRLQIVQQALLGHAVIMHYLPCPDTDMPPDGWENVLANQSCHKDEGVLPWQQLGVSATDAWGRFFRYRADSTFTHHGVRFTISHAENASGIEVTGETGGASSVPSRPVAIVLSHGENGLGGIQSGAGQAHAMASPQSAAELENADGDTSFIDQSQQHAAGAVYDDVLSMLSPKVLIATMVQAQRLP